MKGDSSFRVADFVVASSARRINSAVGPPEGKQVSLIHLTILHSYVVH